MSRLDELRRKYGLEPTAATSVRPNRTPTVAESSPAVSPFGRTPTRLDELRAQYGIEPPAHERPQPEPGVVARFVSDLPEPIRKASGGALRGLASALEPIQLPQDAMFAAIAGAADPDTTITERLRSMEWGKYAPYGEAPARPSSGEEIFSLMGFDEKTSKWAGIAADITVDPLVFGSFVRVAGKASGLADLVRLGDRMDDMISPIGVSREVVKVARKSPRLSSFMDSRMEDLMTVFRNPNSTVFGIQRFGERSTLALERLALPKSQVDRLRFGSEAARDLADARRAAERTGRRLNEDSLRMLYRAQNGVAGEESKNIVRDFLKATEGQRAAYDRRLSNLDPTVREVVESEVYHAIRPEKGDPGIGLLPFLSGDEGIARAFDPKATLFSEVDEGVEELSRQVYGSARELVGARPAVPSRPDPEDIFRVANDRIQDRLNDARGRVGAVARERGERAGLNADALHQIEAQAVRSFDGYLADTLQIDAKLGRATSGYDFVGNAVRTRAFGLTGRTEDSERVWNRVLRRGLLRGQEGIDELKAEPSGIQLSNLLAHSTEPIEDAVRRRQVYRSALEARLNQIKGGVGEERVRRLNLYADEVEDIGSRAESLVREMKANARNYDDLRRPEVQATIKEAEQLTVRYRNDAADLISASGSGVPELSRLLKTEAQLARMVRRQSDLLESASGSIRKGVGNQPIPAAGVRWIDDAKEEASDLADRMASISSERRRYRVEFEREAQARGRAIDGGTARGAREEARAIADREIPRPTDSAPDPVGTLRIGDEVIPLAGRNAVGEDILAARVAGGRFGSVEEAMKAPITYGELLDGAADMQALPIGEFLQGLMNGHLRRAYAVFGSSDDFKQYIDALRVGTIIPSSVIDEADLVNSMRGFEKEAELIQQYHGLMVRNGKDKLLKKSSIAQYLVNSGVEPSRVNATLKAMAQSINPESGALRDFLNRVEAMLPNYRAILAKRNSALANIGEQARPRVTDKRFFDPVEDIPQHMLEQLGEIAQARASLGDSIDVAKRITTKQEMFQGIYETARARGLVRSAPFTDEFGVAFRKYSSDEAVMGGFGGKYIHPHLADELRRASAVEKSNVPYAFTRARALLTGGMLAAPSVIAANFFGGLYQGATVGINPAVMIRRMIEVTDDVDQYSKGYRTELLRELSRNLDIEIGSLRYQDFSKELKKVRLEEFGLGSQGIARAFDDVEGAYTRFLNRPGIGKFSTRFAGLEGFQFTENWFKVAAYKEMKNRIPLQRARKGLEPLSEAMLQKQAAEFARTVVFDYSELPKSLEMLKNYGVVLFPGFTYFLAGRTIDAALRRPGALAVADRISEGLANVSLDLEEQMALLTGSADWMKDDQGVPMPFTARIGPDGEKQIATIPMNQLVPTSTLLDGLGPAGNPWAQSIASGGLMGPLFEIVAALVADDGEAVLSARYGNRVFDADSEGGRKVRDIFRFLYNSMAPSNVKKLITVDMEGQLDGLLPSAPEFFRDMGGFATEPMMEQVYSFEEARRGRPDDTWREEVLRTFLRSPQVVALDGPISGVRRELQNEQRKLNDELAMLRRRANRARAAGDMETYERWADEIRSRTTEFNEKWSTFLEFYRNYQRRRTSERQPGGGD